MPVCARNGKLPSSCFVKTMLCTALISAIFCSISLLADPVNSSHATVQKIDRSDLLWWLPTDTESVVAARGPFPFPACSSAPSEKEEEKWFTAKATLPQIQSSFEELPLETVDDAGLTEMLKGSVVAFALQGTRHFRAPSDDSEVTSYEGCSIVVFQKRVEELEPRLRRVPGWENAEKDSIGGTRVLMVKDQSEGSTEAFFVALPLPNVLLVANNREYLREILDRMKQQKAPRALPEQLPEWRSLSRAARFWGLRHYDPTQAKEDPTSPLGGDTAYVQSDPKAIGALFALDPKNERSLMIEYLTGDEANVKAEAAKGHVAVEPQEGVNFELKLRNPALGVIEDIYTLDRSSTLDYGILAIEFSLGRGMNF
jgi:hypothetical protein